MPRPDAKRCECGCGELAAISTVKKGSGRGKPLRFARGHHGRLPLHTLYVVDPDTGCWIWTSTRHSMGYGEIRRAGTRWLAHRWMWTQHRGPIPEGQHLDHICRNPICVNPDHLRLCSQAENLQNLSPAGRGGTSQYRGVSWCKRAGKWTARVQIAKRVHCLGNFTDEHEAGRVAAAFRASHMPYSQEAAAHA